MRTQVIPWKKDGLKVIKSQPTASKALGSVPVAVLIYYAIATGGFIRILEIVKSIIP